MFGQLPPTRYIYSPWDRPVNRSRLPRKMIECYNALSLQSRYYSRKTKITISKVTCGKQISKIPIFGSLRNQ
jgi:hypothetical protein